MKNILVVVILLISLPLLSQVKDRAEYKSYYIKQPKFTGNQVVEMNYKSVFLDLGEGDYVVDVKLTPDTFMQAKVTYSKTMEFARQTIYIYEGTGSLYLKPMNFVIESTVKLSELCNGNAYKKEDKNLISDYGVHILYWSAKIREPLQKNNFSIYPIQHTDIDEIEAIEEYINPLQQTLTNSYSICEEKESKQINIALFDPDLGNYETASEQTEFCKNDKVITLDFLPEEGIEGFYYFTFNNLSFKEVAQLVLNSYHLPFKTEMKVEQKHIYPEDEKNYTTMVQTIKENQIIIEIRNFYDDNLEGDYIKIEEKSNGSIQVHISYNGM